MKTMIWNRIHLSPQQHNNIIVVNQSVNLIEFKDEDRKTDDIKGIINEKIKLEKNDMENASKISKNNCVSQTLCLLYQRTKNQQETFV